MQPNPTPWHFIVNPAAGGGKGRLRWRKLLPKLRKALPAMTFAISTPLTPLRALARDAMEAGHTHLVGVGGDGTHHHLLNGLVESGRVGEVVYAPLAVGSGNDWVRSLGTPRRFEAWLGYLHQMTTRQQMIGRIDFVETGVTHYFLNVAGFAYDAEVVRIAAEERVRHQWMYPILALSYLSEYRAPSVRLTHHLGTRARAHTLTSVVHTVNVGIGRYSGGGMQFVPHAEPFGDKLGLTVLEKLPLWKVLANSWRLYHGSIDRIREARTESAEVIWLTPTGGTLECEADGEWLGEGRVKITLCPQKLMVVVS